MPTQPQNRSLSTSQRYVTAHCVERSPRLIVVVPLASLNAASQQRTVRERGLCRRTAVGWHDTLILAPSSVSQVKYKTNRHQKAEGSPDLPNLLQLEHALHATKLQSNVRRAVRSRCDSTRIILLLQIEIVNVQIHLVTLRKDPAAGWQPSNELIIQYK